MNDFMYCYTLCYKLKMKVVNEMGLFDTLFNRNKTVEPQIEETVQEDEVTLRPGSAAPHEVGIFDEMLLAPLTNIQNSHVNNDIRGLLMDTPYNSVDEFMDGYNKALALTGPYDIMNKEADDLGRGITRDILMNEYGQDFSEPMTIASAFDDVNAKYDVKEKLKDKDKYYNSMLESDVAATAMKYDYATAANSVQRVLGADEYFPNDKDASDAFLGGVHTSNELIASIAYQAGENDMSKVRDGSAIVEDYTKLRDATFKSPDEFAEFLKPYNDEHKAFVDDYRDTLVELNRQKTDASGTEGLTDSQRVEIRDQRVSDNDLQNYATIAFHGFTDGENPSGLDLINNALDNINQTVKDTTKADYIRHRIVNLGDIHSMPLSADDLFDNAMSACSDKDSVQDYMDTKGLDTFVNEKQKYQDQMKETGVTNKVQSKDVEDDYLNNNLSDILAKNADNNTIDAQINELKIKDYGVVTHNVLFRLNREGYVSFEDVDEKYLNDTVADAFDMLSTTTDIVYEDFESSNDDKSKLNDYQTLALNVLFRMNREGHLSFKQLNNLYFNDVVSDAVDEKSIDNLDGYELFDQLSDEDVKRYYDGINNAGLILARDAKFDTPDDVYQEYQKLNEEKIHTKYFADFKETFEKVYPNNDFDEKDLPLIYGFAHQVSKNWESTESHPTDKVYEMSMIQYQDVISDALDESLDDRYNDTLKVVDDKLVYTDGIGGYNTAEKCFNDKMNEVSNGQYTSVKDYYYTLKAREMVTNGETFDEPVKDSQSTPTSKAKQVEDDLEP